MRRSTFAIHYLLIDHSLFFRSEKGEFYSESSFGNSSYNTFKYSRPDVSIKVGCGAEWNMIYLETGYQFGIANVLDSEEFSQRGNAFFVNFGVNF